MERKKSFLMMAFAAGKESTESVAVKKYIGIAPMYVLAVNPNKAELEKLYNTELEKEPEYLTKTEIDGKEVENIRIDFIVKSDEEKCGTDFTTKLSFFLRKEYRFNRDQTKVQVIDKYGRTAWVTKEQLQTKEIPVYSSGQANLDKDYRPCFVGEEDLTNFIKTFLNIPNVMKYVNNTWVMVDNPSECEARLDNIEKYFKNDFSELKSIIKLQPKNKVKVMFGVRTADDGKQYQTFYSQKVLSNNAGDAAYAKLDKELQERKALGAYSNVEFVAQPITEYTVKATTFTSTPSEDPFASNSEWPFGN